MFYVFCGKIRSGDEMGKYYLVVSYFDGKDFKEERIISRLGEVVLDSLSNIDLLTSRYTKSGLLEEIRREYEIDQQNQVAIKYYKSKDATATYYKVIFYNKEYHEAVVHLKDITYRSFNYMVNGKGISKEVAIWQREKRGLEEILEKRDLEVFYKKYPYQDQFCFAVERYLSSDYDQDGDRERDYRLVFDIFSNYKIFRKWVVAQIPVYSFLKKPSIPLKGEYFFRSQKSMEEHGEDFEREFEKIHGTSYSTYQKCQHNLLYLDEEEVREMYEYGSKLLYKKNDF